MKNGDAQANVIYRGFISYSHNDSATARMIHRRLEAYRLPARLVGKDTPRGAVPARLTPIFRDREELSAGESLSDQVQAALAASACLIILCSPCAKASPWVAREIEMFRTLYPDRPVLAALIAGEPNEAFPQALTAGGLEPIAADFRKGGDGTRLALLKLVAGITATSLDALIQRDAQRQYRRVMAITFGAGVALLAMSALLVMAVRAQNEAQAQRQQAEGLVEYMLTDLRDKLKGVGRLDVMSAVNERAMAYYGAQGRLDRLPAQSLDRRARILHAMGEDDEKRGDLDKALAKFKEAYRNSAQALKMKPNDPAAIYAHGQSEYWLGLIDLIKEHYGSARTHFMTHRQLALLLVKIDPKNAKWLRDASEAEGDVCAVELDISPNTPRPLPFCRRSIGFIEQAIERDKQSAELKIIYANRLAWLADALRMNAETEESYKTRFKQLSILEILVKNDPKNMKMLEYRALYDDAMLIYYKQDKLNRQYIKSKTSASKLYKMIIDVEPDNAEIKRRLYYISQK